MTYFRLELQRICLVRPVMATSYGFSQILRGPECFADEG